MSTTVASVDCFGQVGPQIMLHLPSPSHSTETQAFSTFVGSANKDSCNKESGQKPFALVGNATLCSFLTPGGDTDNQSAPIDSMLAASVPRANLKIAAGCFAPQEFLPKNNKETNNKEQLTS